MGNGRSQAWAREEAVDWREAVTETWRSERSRELDKLGGLGRPTIRRGNSMTEKLVYLQASLNKQGQDMEDALHKGVQKKKMDEKPVSFGFMLATERRALDRGQAEGGGSQQLPPLQQPRSSSVVARQRDYARGPSLQRAATHSYSTGAASGSSTEAAAVAAIADVAEWRLRVHAARRRTMLVVQTVVRLRRGLNHPRRMDRVDSFSLYIPMALADDCGRFVEEAERCATLGVAIRSARAEASSDAALMSALADMDGIGVAAAQQLGFGAGLRSLSAVERSEVDRGGAGAADTQGPQPQGAQGGRVLGLTCSVPRPCRFWCSSSSLRVRARGASASESGAALSRRAHGGAAEKLAALDAVVQAESAKLLRSHGLLGMFVNRANASWAQSLSWRAPAAVSEAEQRLFQASDEYTVFKADLVRKLRAGHVAFQVYAAEDELALPNGQLLDVWTADPWDLVAAARPGREPLKTSLLEELGKHGVEWLVSRRAADLSLLTQTSALDIPELAHVVRLRQSCRALRMSAQATATDSLSVMRAMNSVMLACTRAQPGGSIGDPSGVPTVVELRTCEVASTGMVDTLKRCRTEAGGRVLVGLHRYVYHVPSLGKQLAQTSALRPKLLLEGSTVHVSLEASDLTASGGCVALARGPSPRTLLSPAEVEDLIPLLLEQDHDMRFRRAAGASAQSASSLVAHKGGSTNTNAAAPSPAPSASARGGQLIVVLCSDNSVTVTALELVKLIARPGRDEVSLVTVVRSTLQQEDGRQLLMRLGRELARAMIMPRLDVIVRGHTGLLDAIQEYVVSADAGLVVMGSVALTTCATLAGSGSSGASSVAAAVGSVTVAIAKRLPVPLAVVTANTRLQRSPVESSRLARRFAQQQAHVGGVNGTGAGGELGGLGGRSSAGCGAPRVLAVVERHSQAMLSYLCSRCLDPLRGDQLLLGQVFTTRMLTREQAAGTKRVMESFYDVAAKAHLPPVRMQLNGAFDKALAAASDAEGVQLLALQLKPEERGLPGDVLSLMRSSRAAVLLFHDRPRAVISAPSALPS
ncbi:hypothetical protein FOA52_004766 [Chlamydomonas sp. UWO 241]|nr:hypothetical protein FOA52_004766 [Chlamydomonas sp. UWO 241]